MCQQLANFWRDERGALLVTEWIFLATILVIAIVPALLKIQLDAKDSLVVSPRLPSHGHAASAGTADSRSR